MERLHQPGEHNKRVPRVERDRGSDEPGRLSEGAPGERVGSTDGGEFGQARADPDPQPAPPHEPQ